MFNSAIAFNQPLNNWNVSKVTSMSSMFQSATAFNSRVDWTNNRTAATVNMSSMFNGATKFNDPSILTWRTDNVTNMSAMFAGV